VNLTRSVGGVVLAVSLIAGLGLVSQVGAARPVPTTSLWAVVNLDGTLARGSSTVSSAQLGVDGQYEVVFNRNVAGCAYVASGGEATSLGPDDAVVFTVAPRQDNTSAVFVQEWDGVLGFDSYSSGFHLIVAC
jgi:hypothetical protein